MGLPGFPVMPGPLGAPPMFLEYRNPGTYVDLDWYIRQCMNFDGLWKNSWKDLKFAREKVYNWIANFSTLTHIDTFRGPLHWLPWEDHEIYTILQNAVCSEEEMLRTLTKLPEQSLMYQVRHTKFNELSRLRVELERLLFTLAAEYRRPYYPPVTVVEAPPRPPPAPPTPPPEAKKRYNREFIVYWDYVLNLLKKFSEVQLIYGLYNNGKTVLQPRVVGVSDVMDA